MTEKCLVITFVRDESLSLSIAESQSADIRHVRKQVYRIIQVQSLDNDNTM